MSIKRGRSVSDVSDLLAQWDGQRNEVDPSSVSLRSTAPAWWVCGNEPHSFPASPLSRVRKDGSLTGCSYCEFRKVLVGFNDMATTHPEMSRQWDQARNGDVTPADVTARSSTKFWWVCNLGHSWDAKPHLRSTQNQGCPFCSSRRLLPGFNDLGTKFPDVAREWHPTKNGAERPSDIFPNTPSERWWLCPLGHSYLKTPNKRVGRGEGCPVCSGRQVLAGFNDLASVDPFKAGYWDVQANGGLTPDQITAGNDLRAWWRCPRSGCDRTWKGHVYAVQRCPSCDKFTSVVERELYAFIRGLLPDDVKVMQSVRSVLVGRGRDELDVYVPSLGVAFEFNGIYWHTESQNHGRTNHRDKYEACRRQGIRLVTVWEDDWRERRSIVESMVAHAVGASSAPRVDARSLVAGEVSGVEASRFFDATHIQGSTILWRSYGLRTPDGDLVAVLGLRRPVKGSRTGLLPGDVEIRRYSTAAMVRGGFTKLLAHAERDLKAGGYGLLRWVSFAAHDVSDGSLYLTSGFEAVSEVAPDYTYAGVSTGWNRRNKQNYTKAAFKSSDELIHRDGLTERGLAALNGLERVWDCGKTKYAKVVR